MGIMNKFMLGTDEIFSGVMLKPGNNVNLSTKDSAIYYDGDDIDETFKESDLSNNLFQDNWRVPNMLYCPENIFANKIVSDKK